MATPSTGGSARTARAPLSLPLVTPEPAAQDAPAWHGFTAAGPLRGALEPPEPEAEAINGFAK